MPNTTLNPTPSESDLKAAVECAKSLGMYDLDWHKDRTERIVEIMEEIITHHMQPERNELERLREEVRMEYTQDGLGLVEENLKLRKERNAAQKEVERLREQLQIHDNACGAYSHQLTASRNAMKLAKERLIRARNSVKK